MKVEELPFTLEQLRIIKAIATEGSFKKAAESLYMTQPAISLQIQTLERKLNIALFDRSGRRALMTEAGHLFLRYGDCVLALCEETCHALEDLRNLQGGTLVIGASQTTGTYLMPRLIGLFRQRYPQVTVKLHVHSTRRISWNIANGQVDLAVIGGEVPHELQESLTITPYAEDELVLILPKSHPFAKLDSIQKEDLYRLKFIALDAQSAIRKVIDKVLAQNGIDSNLFRVEMELNSIESIKNAVQSGLGAAFVSVSAIAKELELGILHWCRIENITIKRMLSIITNPNRYHSQAARIFSEEILTMFSLQSPEVKKKALSVIQNT
uniref:Probable RuBisCO transcriptional regulator n=1 Tax=Cyanophora sudae TaxID=1522369 RepID=A0A2Z4HG47_9EUKA|nr:LysR transcriptional regulator [Cyanophora sudae]AWW13624.1 LysR transcriptional regulator [Cyanophora sudae]